MYVESQEGLKLQLIRQQLQLPVPLVESQEGLKLVALQPRLLFH